MYDCSLHCHGAAYNHNSMSHTQRLIQLHHLCLQLGGQLHLIWGSNRYTKAVDILGVG